ncbi:MAG: GAF domain-containing protein [Chitinophagaceae bacterium]
MKKGVISLNQYATKENSVESYVCFKKFIDFLEEKVQTDKSIRVHFFRFVLDKIRSYPALIKGVPVAETAQYDEVLELVAAAVIPLIEDENEILFGLTNGILPQVFYGSNAFYNVFESQPDKIKEQSATEKENALQLHRQIQYDFILQKIYGYELPQKREIIRGFFNHATGLYQYYRINIDSRFVDIKAKSIPLSVSNTSIKACFECTANAFDEIDKLVPLSNFTASGFSIMTLTDITEQQAIEQLSKAIIVIDRENASSDFIHVTRLLQTMLGNRHYQFGLMPFFTINNRAALLYENFPYSIVVKASWDAGVPKPVFTRYINHYLRNPQFISYNAAEHSTALPVPVQEALKAAGIHYYLLAPIYFNDKLVGILETGAGADSIPLTDWQFGKVKPAVPYIAQLLKSLIDKFNIAIDTITREKFTVIQPSVQWKFNEVAWHYFRSHDIEHKNSALEKITFKNVYPLYGAVDIRNSTIERNKALREDLQLQLSLLMELLTHISEAGIGDTAAIMHTCRQWLSKMTAYVSVEEELQFNEFLFSKAHPLLTASIALQETTTQKISAYFTSIDEQTGITFNKRRQLENAIRLLNKSIGRYFDQFKDDLQHYYPCYFEKFRTDGIEYDIYIGQSIAPKIPFSLKEVERLRLWQVESMASITKLTHSLAPRLEHPLQTTQLIFINARTIDISFRNDERRFDVEGAYNIRYHIVKKRIDKVNIFNSTERLTQPGKIAIVYFNERDAAEYIGYIEQLQQQQILLDDLEYLDLEELQGVAGLRALRVGVRLE